VLIKKIVTTLRAPAGATLHTPAGAWRRSSTAEPVETPLEWHIAGLNEEMVQMVKVALRKKGQDVRLVAVESDASRSAAGGMQEECVPQSKMYDWCELAVLFAPVLSAKRDQRIRDILARDCQLLGIDPASPASGLYRLAFKDSHPHDNRVIDVVSFPKTARELSPGYHELSSYNRTLPPKVTGQEKEKIAKAEEWLCIYGGALSAQTQHTLCRVVVPHMVRADLLADYFQHRYLLVSQVLFWLGAFAVTVVIGQTLFLPAQPWLLIFEIAALAAAVLFYWWSHHAGWHESWLNARFLAEQFRSQQFTAALGLPRDLAPEPRWYLSFYKGPHTWLVDVPHNLAAELTKEISEPVKLQDARKFMQDGWIKHQIDYHQGNARAKRRLVHRYEHIGLVLFGLTIVAALCHMLGVGHIHDVALVGQHGHEPVAPPSLWNLSNFNPSNFFTFIALALPAWGSALQAISNQLELRRVAARSERMERVLRVAALHIEEASSLAELRQAASEAGLVMRSETHEWWVLLGFRDPALPA